MWPDSGRVCTATTLPSILRTVALNFPEVKSCLLLVAGGVHADEGTRLLRYPDIHGDQVVFGDVALSVIHLRGHTAGSIALAYDDPAGHVHLFTGDSLFHLNAFGRSLPGLSMTHAPRPRIDLQAHASLGSRGG